MEPLFRCNFKCWKNGEFKTIKVTYVALSYDTDLNWIVAKQGRSVRSSYKISNITDVRLASWGAFLHHISVAVWVTDDDGNRFEFDYDGPEAPKVCERIKVLAEAHSPYFRALPKVESLLNGKGTVALEEILEVLPESSKARGTGEARELVEHLMKVNAVSGRMEGDAFIREIPPSEGV